jgi:pimeloyl-ACP methyl ester carboxylesterase
MPPYHCTLHASPYTTTQTGLRSAWFDKTALDLDTINHYRWPSLVKRWDAGLALFTLYRTSRKLRGEPGAPGVAADTTLVQAVAERAKAGMSVIIIHGTEDRTIGIAASRRLMKAVPTAELVELPRCGHVPHEEQPDKFLEILRNRLLQQ